jgi:hypothetical protein
MNHDRIVTFLHNPIQRAHCRRWEKTTTEGEVERLRSTIRHLRTTMPAPMNVDELSLDRVIMHVGRCLMFHELDLYGTGASSRGLGLTYSPRRAQSCLEME